MTDYVTGQRTTVHQATFSGPTGELPVGHAHALRSVDDQRALCGEKIGRSDSRPFPPRGLGAPTPCPACTDLART